MTIDLESKVKDIASVLAHDKFVATLMMYFLLEP